jgi:hypothetical protein
MFGVLPSYFFLCPILFGMANTRAHRYCHVLIRSFADEKLCFLCLHLRVRLFHRKGICYIPILVAGFVLYVLCIIPVVGWSN